MRLGLTDDNVSTSCWKQSVRPGLLSVVEVTLSPWFMYGKGPSS